jgi:hypothetical protein
MQPGPLVAWLVPAIRVGEGAKAWQRARHIHVHAQWGDE